MDHLSGSSTQKDRKKLTSPKFLDIYRPLLKPGGTINLKTDSPELYVYTLEMIEEHGLTLHRNVEDVHRDCPNDSLLQIRTYYEGLHLEEDERFDFYHSPYLNQPVDTRKGWILFPLHQLCEYEGLISHRCAAKISTTLHLQ